MSGKKVVALLALVAIVLPVAACQTDGTQELTRAQVESLRIKMTQDEVEKVLGNPKYESDTMSTWTPKKGAYRKVDVLWNDRGQLASYNASER
ncbi:MAG: hypothetical protein U0166_06750 [Acidobacteriota bacterium]